MSDIFTSIPPEALISRVVREFGDSIEATTVIVQSEDRAKCYVTDVKQFRTRMSEIEDKLHVDISCIVVVDQKHAQLLVKPRA